jgi:hypothetical protein
LLLSVRNGGVFRSDVPPLPKPHPTGPVGLSTASSWSIKAGIRIRLDIFRIYRFFIVPSFGKWSTGFQESISIFPAPLEFGSSMLKEAIWLSREAIFRHGYWAQC